jgi:signal transduction histidine kinase
MVGALFLWVLTTVFGAIAGAAGGPLGIVVAFAAVAVLVMIVAGIARRVAAPAEDLVSAAERIEAGDLSVRVAERGPREARSLARAFNAMAARLQANEERRRSFLADAAHELRTPLTVIRGRTEAMIDGVYPADAANLAVVLEETRTLERLVEDLRTVGLLDAGALTLVRAPTDPATLIDDALAAFRPQADAAGVELRGETADGLPLVDVDPIRIRGVLANLLSNAIRHTPRGGSVSIGAAAGPPGLVTCSVTDTGEGMAPELVATALDRSAKGPGSGGSGLGLAIARDLVAAHGGTIGLESSPGQGTTVTFTLPVASRGSVRGPRGTA